MRTTDDLKKLSETLRDTPRHLWDKRLLEFCEALVAEADLQSALTSERYLHDGFQRDAQHR